MGFWSSKLILYIRKIAPNFSLQNSALYPSCKKKSKVSQIYAEKKTLHFVKNIIIAHFRNSDQIKHRLSQKSFHSTQLPSST